ncbi:thioredoxin-like protein [Crepidotus variabilis]|uniref:Thioredoxin-like protein n=1 Tax=Crepidotus variabilis TaxID=179855 RepID=A0A9P6JKQ4_9AGAR|nr:thioredoxin-like protein [Crepidotus variabilis]
MFSRTLLALLALSPIVLVNAGIFPKNSPVKMLDPKGFREAMKLNQTSVVAFVAPWCGHCQRMGPEYEKAAKGLNPLIATYAVDCDEDKNKKLCAQQEVKGFPTVKVFPRGKSLPPMNFEQERTSNSIYNFAARRVPKAFKEIIKEKDVKPWIQKNKSSKHRALLLTKDKRVPLLWKVVANAYSHTDIEFGAFGDKEGKLAKELGFDEGKSTVVLFQKGEDSGKKYTGVTKLEELTKFFKSVADEALDTLPLEASSAKFPTEDGDAESKKPTDEL